MTPADHIPVSSLLILEYERLKEEQKVRIGMRDNLIYVTIAAMAVVVAAVLPAGGQPELLLLLPPVAFLLGWTYVANDEKISAIGRYIRERLAPKLAELTGGDVAVFGWETAHRADAHRVSRKYMQLGVDLTAFCLAPAAALAVYWAGRPVDVPLAVVSFAEAVALCLLAVHVVLYADLKAPPG